jgi:hypothetical protein
MKQFEIIEYVTKLFAEKLEKIEVKGYKVFTEEPPEKEKKYLKLIMYGMEEVHTQNKMEKYALKGIDEKGKEYEYLISAPTMLSLKFVVIPHAESNKESQLVIGSIIKLLKDDHSIKVGDYDWVRNDGEDIVIENNYDMDLDKQLQIFSAIDIKYKPAIFFQMMVGIDSGDKQITRIVLERKFDTYDKDNKLKVKK